MKALMYTLIRAVEFDIDPTLVIESKSSYVLPRLPRLSQFRLTVMNHSIVTRPRVVGQPEKGNQMPLICKVVQGV